MDGLSNEEDLKLISSESIMNFQKLTFIYENINNYLNVKQLRTLQKKWNKKFPKKNVEPSIPKKMLNPQYPKKMLNPISIYISRLSSSVNWEPPLVLEAGNNWEPALFPQVRNQA